MNLTTRIEKLEARLEEITPKEDSIDYVILFKRDENSVEHYRIRKDGEWYWVTKEELNKFLEKPHDAGGMIIFYPAEKHGEH